MAKASTKKVKTQDVNYVNAVNPEDTGVINITIEDSVEGCTHCVGGLTLAQTLCPNCNGTTVVVPADQSFAR